ncbi:JmjC domain [Cinara cedri]|uniref:[histone H3]-dimethyl-L-lysine(9) demethylase n=1 Tax=Cinara cedri TaxID=506608 RepID=A0A5E4NLW0_9HEMI|nr:JmjC domain [Cinara cedri]
MQLMYPNTVVTTVPNMPTMVSYPLQSKLQQTLMSPQSSYAAAAAPSGSASGLFDRFNSGMVQPPPGLSRPLNSGMVQPPPGLSRPLNSGMVQPPPGLSRPLNSGMVQPPPGLSRPLNSGMVQPPPGMSRPLNTVAEVEHMNVAPSTIVRNEQQQQPPLSFSGSVWRDPNMMRSADGTIRHVDSVQHQNLYASNVPQLPQVQLMSYGQFQPPPPPPHQQTATLPPPLTIQPSGIINPTGSFYNSGYPPNDPRHKLLNRENSANDVIDCGVLNQMSHGQQQQYVSPGKRSCGSDDNRGGPSRYGQQMDVDRTNTLQLPTGDSQEQREKLQAAAAVQQHFEESLKLAQQPKGTHWTSNLHTLPTNQETKVPPDLSNKRSLPLHTIENQKIKLSKMTPPTGPSSDHQAYGSNQTGGDLSYSLENLDVVCKNDEYNRQSVSGLFAENPENIHTDDELEDTPPQAHSSNTMSTSTSRTFQPADVKPTVPTYNTPATPPPVLTPADYPEIIRHSHHKLKKTWLQRHTLSEDQKESSIYMGPSTSTASVSQIDDIPPVLQCEKIGNKRDKSNNVSNSQSSSSARETMPENNEPIPSKKRRVPDSTSRIITRIDSDTGTTASEANDIATTANNIITAVDRKNRVTKNKKSNNPNKHSIMVKIPLGSQITDGEEVFFQSDPCLNPSLKDVENKCRECLLKIEEEEEELISDEEKVFTSQSEIDKIYCRFYQFRLVFKNNDGQLIDAGFPDPYKDIKVDDLNLWMPNSSCPPQMNIKVAKRVLQEAGQQFCNLVKEEKKTLTLSHINNDYPIVWKKAINGVRLMCDVCVTTIFNYHFACQKCGFDVCTDCAKDRLDNKLKFPNRVLVTNNHTLPLHQKDAYKWMICSDNKPHEITELMFTQMLAGDSLNIIFNNLHTVCTKWKILLECGCPGFPIPEYETNSDDSNNNPVKKSKMDSSTQNSNTAAASPELQIAGCSRASRRISIRSFSQRSSNNEELKHFIRTKNRQIIPNNQLPQRTMTLEESKQIYPNNPHTWLCDGRLLRLLDPYDSTNYSMFREQWLRGQPVLVSGVNKKLKKRLWTPKSFIRDFGELENDLVDCITGQIVENEKMKVFWEGFVDEKKRMKDSSGKTMLLKLKDWPGAADFSETMPKRFKNLMAALPLKDYTHREGKLNLANRLPDNFLKPDLGPKMYSAYGDAAASRHPKTRLLGTTNLHLDVSDAVNVMAFVSISKSESENNRLVEEAYKIIDQSGCDRESKRRARMHNEYPGAVWHIYHANDSDAIRDLLNKVSDERGRKLQANHDPIHDQSSYLDEKLRTRLYHEYGIRGYAVLQCLGDAILIPAGAPHQVRNLHNCIKVAQDFVSPENLAQCFQLTNEFRDLSSSHSNHEDKLQIKNIMYHAVKDSLSVLMHEEPPPERKPRGRPRLIKKEKENS